MILGDNSVPRLLRIGDWSLCRSGPARAGPPSCGFRVSYWVFLGAFFTAGQETRQANSVLDHLLNNTLSPENQVRLLTEVLGNPWVKERYKSDFNLIQEKEPTFLELGRIMIWAPSWVV